LDTLILQILINKYGQIIKFGDLSEHSYTFEDVYVLFKDGKITIFSNKNSEILLRVNSNLTPYVFDQVLFVDSWNEFQKDILNINLDNILYYEEKYNYSYSIRAALNLLKGGNNTQW